MLLLLTHTAIVIQAIVYKQKYNANIYQSNTCYILTLFDSCSRLMYVFVD